MRHRVDKHHFNRNTKARKALLKSLLRSLVEQGEVITTTAKAKELRRLMDKVVHKAQADNVETRRLLHRAFGRRDVVNTLVDRIAPAMADRVSGFTTLSKVGSRRGDSAEMTKIKFMVEIPRSGSLKSGQVHTSEKANVVKAKTSTKAKAKVETKTTKAKKAEVKETAVKAPLAPKVAAVKPKMQQTVVKATQVTRKTGKK